MNFLPMYSPPGSEQNISIGSSISLVGSVKDLELTQHLIFVLQECNNSPPGVAVIEGAEVGGLVGV